jgi:hypothetical protein
MTEEVMGGIAGARRVRGQIGRGDVEMERGAGVNWEIAISEWLVARRGELSRRLIVFLNVEGERNAFVEQSLGGFD